MNLTLKYLFRVKFLVTLLRIHLKVLARVSQWRAFGDHPIWWTRLLAKWSGPLGSCVQPERIQGQFVRYTSCHSLFIYVFVFVFMLVFGPDFYLSLWQSGLVREDARIICLVHLPSDINFVSHSFAAIAMPLFPMPNVTTEESNFFGAPTSLSQFHLKPTEINLLMLRIFSTYKKYPVFKLLLLLTMLLPNEHLLILILSQVVFFSVSSKVN